MLDIGGNLRTGTDVGRVKRGKKGGGKTLRTSRKRMKEIEGRNKSENHPLLADGIELVPDKVT